jgi:hypothetical protein
MSLLLLLLLTATTVVSGNYHSLSQYTGSNACDERSLGQIYVDPHSNCTVGEVHQCFNGGGHVHMTSHRQGCHAEMPVIQQFGGVAISRRYSTPDCTGEPEFIDIQRLRFCSMFNTYMCSHGTLTVTRFETIGCESPAGSMRLTAQVGKCTSTPRGTSTFIECT